MITIALLIKLITFNNYSFYDGHIIDIPNSSFYSIEHKTWYEISRNYWENYSKRYKLTMSDKEKLKILGWEDLIIRPSDKEKP